MNSHSSAPGFAIVSDVVDDAAIATLSDSLDALDARSRAGARHLMQQPPVARIARDDRLVRIASRFIGPDATPFRATLFDKSPAHNWLVAWHQDTALPLRERREAAGWGPWSTKHGVAYAHAPADVLATIVALRLSLDDSDATNGCLRVLPDTHGLGLLSDDAIVRLARDREAVECVVARGGVVAMRPLTVHASSKASTARRRRVLHIEYAASLVLADGMELAIA